MKVVSGSSGFHLSRTAAWRPAEFFESTIHEVPPLKTNHFLWRATLVATLSACILPVASPIQAQKWGNLSGKFVLDGDVPAPDEIVNMKEPICTAKVLTDELVVNKENKGIANLFVFIPAAKKPAVHPSLAKSKDKEAVLDQKNCQFLPHAQVMRTDQILMVKSMDNCNHNTRPNPIKNNPVNFTVPPNSREGLPWKVNVAENLPTQIKCDIHPWMSAYCLVLDHPYGVATDKDGKFKIENLPAGELEFRYWHERAGYVEKSVKITIEDGKTKDLGTIKVPAAKLAKQ